jgi:preprotein translocase subunit SecG
MYQIFFVVHMVVSVLLIGLILIQHGKGADAGAAFGSGASGTVFGSQGSSGFLFKFTSLLAAMFFVTSLSLGYIVASNYYGQQSMFAKPAVEKKVGADIALPKDEK